jgi:hypothetical protein
MAKPRAYERNAWDDRFNRPTVGALRGALPELARDHFDLIRSNLLAIEGASEDFAWQGDCWRWTIEYRTKHSKQPLAVLVPSPTDLQVAVPMDLEFIRSLPIRRMKRSVRDGIDLAQEPFDTRWGVWSIQSPGLIEDVVDLVEQMLQHQAQRVG